MYLAKGAAATTAIEGNTLTEKQVLALMDGKLELPPSKDYLAREVDNILKACNEITHQLAATNDLPPLTPERICIYNRQVREGLPEGDDLSPPGELRTGSVIVGRVYRGAPAQDCPHLLERLCQWLEEGFSSHEGYELPFAIIKSIMAHLYLAWIHPFDDGNGRTARLIELHILLEAGVPAPAAHLLSNHYNTTRAKYARELDRASKSGGDVLPFVDYAVTGLVDDLREQLEYVWDQQWDAAWQNHVHQCFKGKDGTAAMRQRHLALDLGTHREWVRQDEIPLLTTRVTLDYARKSERTLLRDLVDLEEKNLIERKPGKVRANREIIHTFRPLRKINS